MSLNQDQQKAVDAVFSFLMSEDKEFIISGPAGTGKTYLMQHVMKHVLEEYENACKLLGITPIDYEIQLTATTNKATEVLTQATGFPARTIHSFMNLQVKDNYSNGTTEIKPTKNFVVHHKKLIFIDEASMVDSKLYDFLQKGTDNTCKIIYLGDHCQMAPVFEKISPVYRNPKNIVHLTIPVRNAEQPELMKICSRFRNTVETLDFFEIQGAPGVVEYLDDAAAGQFIDQTFKDENPDARILCFTNARVHEYNQHIRDLRGYPDHFVKGEVLINNSAKQFGKLMMRVEEEFIVYDDPKPVYELFADDKDPNSGFDVYDVTLGFGNKFDPIMTTFEVKIPVSMDRVKTLIRHYGNQKDWDRYFWLKNTFPDLRQKDAATVYKAQGSTYETVFLDLKDIGKCKHADQVARMLYVGVSRPTTKLYLYGQLPDRYRNKIAIAA